LPPGECTRGGRSVWSSSPASSISCAARARSGPDGGGPTIPCRRHIVPGLPASLGGRRVGLLGGSFNPAHEGHLHISRVARARLRLDAVWWLVSPQNPLKSAADTAAQDARIERARALTAGDRFIRVTGAETELGIRNTIDLARTLRVRYGRARLVWLMGADNLAGFHLWKDWRGIAALLPIAVIDRPGFRHAAVASKAARVLAPFRWPEEAAIRLADAAPPAWVLLRGPLSHESSTAIRARATRTGVAGAH
jgi:nicotinate-nucleotide adenylyltransferase